MQNRFINFEFYLNVKDIYDYAEIELNVDF
jgi:hypothetical protein